MHRQIAILVAVTALTLGPATVSGAVSYAPTTPPASAGLPHRVGASTADPRFERTAAGTAIPAGARPVDNGFHWGDAGIGAGFVAAVTLLALGLATSHRHRPQPR